MVRLSWPLAAATLILSAVATPLQDVCTIAYVRAHLPAQDLYLTDGTYIAITIDPSSVNATAVTNTTVSGQAMYPNATFDYCDVTFAYTHTGRDDRVLVRYWLPAPDSFKNRYLSTGGGGFAINSGTNSLPGGVMYGAVAGATDGGFGGFTTQFNQVWLLHNGTANWEPLFMFGYQAIHELTILGKLFTQQFFNMSSTKLYSYYQGCSEGGRDGWSQLQRFTTLDGAVTGAPAFRFAQQQVQHLWSNVVEHTLNYHPPPCELDKIFNETLAFCDPLDGKTDGIVARSDLCKLKFNISSTIGMPYSCPATKGNMMIFPAILPNPAQSGVVTTQGAAVAQAIIDGMRDSQGRQVYLSYQPAATFADAATLFNTTSNSFGLYINSMGGEYVAKFLQLLNLTNLPNLDGVTYDTLRDWTLQGWQTYEDTLQTTYPDLTHFQASGGKILHWHGEADNSIPAGSSVHYHESVRQVMYPNATYNESTTAMGDWYRLFIVPGIAHCNINTFQPNAAFPQTNLATLIDWVEKDIVPTTLNATVLAGPQTGRQDKVCAWPLRPFWTDNTTMECQYDQPSINSWLYDFDSFKVPTY